MAKDPIKTLEDIEAKLDKKVEVIMNKIISKIRRRVASQEFIKWKSKRVPVVVDRARLVGDLMTAKVRGASGWKWGLVHIGPAGSSFTIENFGGMLAIPTDAARQTFRGKKLGPKHYGGTWIHNNIIWGKAGWGGAKTGGYLRQRRAAGEKFKKETPIPLFILKKSVVVRRRIHPADLTKWGHQLFLEALKKGGLLKP